MPLENETTRPLSQTVHRKSAWRCVGVVLLFIMLNCTGYAETPAATENEEETRLDRTHHYLSNRVLRLAESFNTVISATFHQEADHEFEMIRRFYGNLLTAYQVEGSHIRVTPRLSMTEGRAPEYKLDFSARLRLPDLSKRLRLYADSYDTDYDTMEEIFSARYRRQLEAERGEGPTAGLMYFFSDRMQRQLSLSTGLRFRPEPSPKIRIRGRLRKSLDIWRADAVQSVFWSTDQYLVRATWRRRVHRDWLFLEIEPGLDFFREDNFKTTPLVKLRLEIVIGSFKRL